MANIPSFLRGMFSSMGSKDTQQYPPAKDNPKKSLPYPEKLVSSDPPKEKTTTPPLRPTEEPAIRTMKSDIERLFKTAPLSVAQMIGNIGPASTAARRQTKIVGIYLWLGIMLVLFLAIGGTAYYFRALLLPPSPATEIKKAVPPAPFFATESSRTIAIAQTDRQQFLALMQDAMKKFEREGTLTRILIKLTDTPDERFARIHDFLGFYHIVPPENFLKRIESPLMTYVLTTSNEGTRLGLAMRTNDASRTLRDMLDWEPKMMEDLRPLFFDRQIAPVTLTFEDRSYRNIDWRYLKLSADTDIGIAYTIFPAGNVLVITTSKGLMETVINRLFDAK